MYLGLVLTVMIVSGTFILLSLQKIEEVKSRNQLRLYGERITEQIIEQRTEDEFQEELLKFYQASSSNNELQCSIIDASGETLATTTASARPYPQITDYTVITALSGEPSFEFNKKSTDETGLLRQWVSYALPVSSSGASYVVFTRLDASEIANGISQTRQSILMAVLLALLLSAVMGYIFANSITDPILELTKRAKELAGGKLDVRIKVKAADEIGQLTSSFNDMAKELSKNMREISTEKNKLEIILHNMSDGVVSFDGDGNLVHANSEALEMLELEEFDLDFTRFIKKFDITSGIYLDVGPSESKQVTFPVGDKFITANFSPYSGKNGGIDGLVVVLQDTTEAKKLDDMRKEFVANVSHELRTPLTTVKSYTETLMDGALEDEETAMEFLGIINSEADRMAFLVRDLLQLSRFDNKQIELSLSSIDVNAFMEQTVKQNKIHAENKRQRLYFVPFVRDIYITADRDRVSQVVNNIITNAIKYSLENAEIRAYVAEDSDYCKIIIKDTGMGIQRDELPRIFERFYRVDKARSRAMGGTGLGLAIAKEIMELHGGRITVESQYGKGTTMTLWFPKRVNYNDGGEENTQP